MAFLCELCRNISEKFQDYLGLQKNKVQPEALYKIFLLHPSVQTDSRKLQPGDIFFALKGPSFNGNAFALKALEDGASFAVIDEDIFVQDDRLIRVTNVLETLQALAGYHRDQFSIPFIGITGSNGKTTSKELIYAVLSAHFRTYTTMGNLNNHIGVPLTLLSVKPDAEMAVIEMGANHQKEIEGYCLYTKPTHGVITNCGKAHLEGFGGEEGVRKGKGELYDFIRKHDGSIFLYTDYDYLKSMSQGIRNIITYGTKEGIVQGNILTNAPFLEVSIKDHTVLHSIRTNLVGDYNLPNVLCAVAIGKHFLVPDEKIKKAIESYAPSNSRSQWIQRGSNSIILDAYNANPTSMKAAIENFSKLPAERKVLMLGGMMELGEDSIREHATIIELVKQYPWDYVILVGGDFASTHNGITYFPNALEAKAWFQKKKFTDTHFLVKGSRSMQMEKILE